MSLDTLIITIQSLVLSVQTSEQKVANGVFITHIHESLQLVSLLIA